MPSTRTFRASFAALIAFAIILPSGISPVSAAPPADFEDVLVAEVSAPMDVAWTPDGRMLIINKAGQLRIFQNGTMLATAALNLAASLCTNGERGLAGLAVHPSFATNRFIYLYYTYNRGSTACVEHEVDGPVNRLSRFVLGDNNIVNPASETVLFTTPPMYRDHHTGGDVKFGKDGNLYITVGDSGAQSLGWPQDLGKLAGKLVRITDSGGIPAGNPYSGAGSARCNVAGVPPAGSAAGTRCQEIFSYGFRNPFRFAHDPNATGTRYFINDVGQHTWEDISEGPVAGGNYGWQLREGPCAKDTDTGCGSVAGMVDPVHWYHHGEFGAAATAGAFVPNGIWPAEYSGKYLFADYVFGKIYRLDPGGTRCLNCAPPTSGFNMTEFGDFGQVVSMRFGPDNSLYYVSREGSVIRKITYTGGANRAPTARATATPSSGPVPLQVAFNGTTSSDPDGDPLTYAWDFDANGSTDSTVAAPTFTYTAPTTVDARLTVNDGRGGTHSTTVHIVAGNSAPTPVISSPTSTATFAVGDSITLTGSATDPEQGTLPASALTWEVTRHHATHTHPFLEPTSGNNLPITFPEPEDLDAAADSWLEVRLTATDSGGVSTTVTRNLNPKKVPITFQTTPSGLGLTAGGMSLNGPTTVESWQGFQIPVNAPDQSMGGTSYRFDGWSDGGARSHSIATPAVATTYTASFVEAAATEVTFTPVADSYVEASRTSRNNGTRNQLRVDGSPIIRSYLRFNVQGATDFSSARLRLFLNSTSSAGIQVRPVSNTIWGETTITYANAPAFGDVAATSPGGASGTWVTVDITSLVTQNGLLSLALTAPDGQAVSVASRESANDPQLLVGTAAPPPPPPPPPPPSGTYTVSRDAGTNTYRATSTGASFVGTLKSVVQSAIAQLNGSGGGSINFTAGDFDLGADQFELDAVADITFSGAGMSQTTIRNFSSAAGDTEPFDIVVGDRLVFRDMTIRAGGPLRSTSDGLDFDAGNNILVERVAVTESRSKGIIFDGKGAGWSANGNTVRNCVITGIPSDGIELLASSNNVIEGCTITNVGGHGIQATKSSTTAAQPNKKSNDNVIRNNTITNSGQDGVNINSSDRNQVLSNTIKNSSDITSGRDGIRVGSSDAVTCNDNSADLNLATDDQAIKTQSYGLNISHALCSRTVVGGGNNFAGNRVGAVRDVGTDTIFGAPPNDTQPPTTPTNLQAVAASGCEVNLSWTASTDNVGVTGYRIYRNGAFLASVDGTTLTYSDQSVGPSQTYTYRVDAVDAANLASPQSAPDTVTTPATACSAVLVPVADSYVDASQPTVNFGTSTQLRADGSPVVTSYLRFNVQAPSISGATLRIFVNSNHTAGFGVRPVADDTWGETTINGGNAPAAGAVAASSGGLVGGTWVEIDVSSLVTENGLVSIALTTTSGTAMSLASRQAGVNAPQLVVNN